MALLLREVMLTLDEDETLLPARVAGELGLSPRAVRQLDIVRCGIDARQKKRILRVYTVRFETDDEEMLLARHKNNPRLSRTRDQEMLHIRRIDRRHRVLVAGMGPAGLFAALYLARAGVEVTLVERGRPVESRVKDVRRFRSGGIFDPVSNIQFGEGGAGTFSDGKLTTRVKHPWNHFVLQTLVDFGADPDILRQAKPHVGTDRLRLVLIRFRQELLSLGVDIRYETRLSGLDLQGAVIQAGLLDGGEEVPCDSLVLATGHSARDTYDMLQRAGVVLESKPFAVGVRVEHPAELINRIQYGKLFASRLPAADYALTWNDPESGRGIYSFCMCPGGEVVVASSEPGGMVVNGMSPRRRDGAFSNSALVVSVRQEDFGSPDPLAGVRFQQCWERAAFLAGGGNYCAPAQNLLAFLVGGSGPLDSSCRPGVRAADLREVLPAFVVDGLRRALPHFERRMRGFVTREATLVGVETRTSAPVRISRRENGEAVAQIGLYPVGEGAGYAGGIMSAALDGLRTAEQIIQKTARDRSSG
ncbi:MAG: FAD-dependent oxidoreductase [Syntrophotaleaceae bacterium]